VAPALQCTWAVGRDDQRIAYRKIVQLGRALRGESQLLEEVAVQEEGGIVMSNESSRPEGAASRPLQSAGTGELLGQLFRQTSELLRTELDLARAETRTTIQAAMAGLVGMLTAAVFGMVALGCFAASLVLALSQRLAPWSAALLTGGILLVIAVGLVLAAKTMQRKKPLEKTQKTLKEDVQWAKERAA